jgi:hypothetical protein
LVSKLQLGNTPGFQARRAQRRGDYGFTVLTLKVLPQDEGVCRINITKLIYGKEKVSNG